MSFLFFSFLLVLANSYKLVQVVPLDCILTTVGECAPECTWSVYR